jgi:hypothetical protein
MDEAENAEFPVRSCDNDANIWWQPNHDDDRPDRTYYNRSLVGDRNCKFHDRIATLANPFQNFESHFSPLGVAVGNFGLLFRTILAGHRSDSGDESVADLRRNRCTALRAPQSSRFR